MIGSGTTGKCALCGQGGTEAEVVHHLAECAPKHDRKGPARPLIQLRFEGTDDPRYWIHVEADGGAALRQVDSLLRDVWLECCGHMSAFRVGGAKADWRSKAGEVFHRRRLKFDYEYDFGTTTALKGQVVNLREGRLGRDAVQLLLRNDPLRLGCTECAEPATVVCPYCIYEGPSLFCETHAARHPHAEEEIYLPVVNSPRMGMCGYTG